MRSLCQSFLEELICHVSRLFNQFIKADCNSVYVYVFHRLILWLSKLPILYQYR